MFYGRIYVLFSCCTNKDKTGLYSLWNIEVTVIRETGNGQALCSYMDKDRKGKRNRQEEVGEGEENEEQEKYIV